MEHISACTHAKGTRYHAMSGISAQYEKYLRSDHWREVRRKVLARADGECENCGCARPDDELHVHHRTYKRLGNEDLRDVEALCQICHDLEHPGWNKARNRVECPKKGCHKKFDTYTAIKQHLRDSPRH